MRTENLSKKTVWQISREYAGIAEAGGVKNVACSLAEGLAAAGINVTQFIPLYGCVSEKITDKTVEIKKTVAHLNCNGNQYNVRFRDIVLDGVHIIFVDNDIYRNKNAVYTYTPEDEKLNPGHRRGTGHTDANEMNVVFQKAVLLYARIMGTVPDVLQCQDAHTALIPAFIAANPALKSLFEHTKCIVTIHNAGGGYRQQFENIETAYRFTELPYPMLKTGLLDQAVEPFLIAANFAALTTVSPWYAAELTDPANGSSPGLSRMFYEKGINITGITNGIDYDRYDPSTLKKSGLTHKYSPDKGDLNGKYLIRADFLAKTLKKTLDLPDVEQFGFIDVADDAVYFSYHGRIVHQKGLDILALAAERVLNTDARARFIIIGQGDSDLELLHIKNAQQFEGRYLYLRGYERSAARTCVAAADFLVLPSAFEPCGLEDFIGQIYGTIPVAHAVGGLQKIIHQKTGWLYHNNTPEGLADVLLDLCRQKSETPDFFDEIICTAAASVRKNYSWQRIIREEYLKLYF